ncbi:hypothetical protein CPC16_001383, partial [Podila verticillata]
NLSSVPPRDGAHVGTTFATPLQIPMRSPKSMTPSQDDDTISLLHQMARNVVESWGVDAETLEKTHRDIQLVVETAMSDGVFVAQGFIYNLPRCPIDVPHPACLSNLVVVAQIQEVIDDQVVKFNPGHLFVTSITETHQQPWNYHWCHKYRLISRCCHDETRYRDLDLSELEDVKAVLFTYQSEWALERLPPALFFDHMDTTMQVATAYPTVDSSLC